MGISLTNNLQIIYFDYFRVPAFMEPLKSIVSGWGLCGSLNPSERSCRCFSKGSSRSLIGQVQCASQAMLQTLGQGELGVWKSRWCLTWTFHGNYWKYGNIWKHMEITIWWNFRGNVLIFFKWTLWFDDLMIHLQYPILSNNNIGAPYVQTHPNLSLMAKKRAWGAQDSRRVSLQPQIWSVQMLRCTHLGVSINGDTPTWMVYKGESHDWGVSLS